MICNKYACEWFYWQPSCMICFNLFFFSEHQAVTNDTYFIDSDQSSATAYHIARKYIYTSQTNYKV